MCTDCNEITIPTGETGATGSTGAIGAAGTNGSNGTTILATYNSIPGTGTPASLVETTLFTYTMPANTLLTNGDELELYLVYNNDVTDDTTLRLKLGSKIYTINHTGVATINASRTLRLKISRISQTSQFWTLDAINATALGNYTISLIATDSSTVDLGTILAFAVTGQNDVTAVSNQLVVYKATLYKYSA